MERLADPELETWRSGDSRDGLSEAWRYRELFYFLALRDVKVRYKQTALGIAWAVLQPFLTMIVFTVLFGRIANLPTDGVPAPLFYFSALLPWLYFSASLNNVGMSLVSNASLLTKIYFPRIILPSAAALSGLLDFLIGSLLLIGLIFYYGLTLRWAVLLWPVLVILLFLLTLGVGAFFAALNVRYRDVKYAMPFLVQLWLFVTPIIYPTSLVPERFQWLLALNPLSGIIEGFRFALVPVPSFHWEHLGASVVVTLILLLGAFAFFKKTERAFADIV
jgi:lipopolysaccharide transport system permease protein